MKDLIYKIQVIDNGYGFTYRVQLINNVMVDVPIPHHVFTSTYLDKNQIIYNTIRSEVLNYLSTQIEKDLDKLLVGKKELYPSPLEIKYTGFSTHLSTTDEVFSLSESSDTKHLHAKITKIFPGGSKGLPTLATLKSYFPAMVGAMIVCPDCAQSGLLENIIIELNDVHSWSRENIADWLETLDLDLSIKEEGESSEVKGS